MPTTKVPVGVTTVAGYGGTLLGPVAFVLAQFLPDQDQQTIAELASAVLTIGSFLVTQAGRYLQAKELAKKPAAPSIQIPSVQTTSGGIYPYITTSTTPLYPYGTATPGVTPETPDGLPDGNEHEDLDPDPPEGPDPSAAFPSLDEPEGKTVTRSNVTPVTTHDHLDG